jgi:ArsR family transcriptional regulator
MKHTTFYSQSDMPVKATVGWEPVLTALVSLIALTDVPLSMSADAWVLQTGARMTPEQRRRNREVFEQFGEALLPALDAPDFPAFLNTLQHAPDAEVRNIVAPHLREMWEQYLRAEWHRHASQLRWLTNNPLRQQLAALSDSAIHSSLKNRRSTKQQLAAAAVSAIEVAQSLLRRDLPTQVMAQLAGVDKVVFLLSPHVKLFVNRFSSPDTAYVFMQYDNNLVRIAPIQRTEVLGPLSALADDARLRLLELLAANGEMRGQDLVTQMDVSQPNVSRHLKQLVGAGLVEERRAGDANKLYRLNAGGVRSLFEKLEMLLSEANAQAALAQHAAKTQRNAALATYSPDLRPFVDEHGRVTNFSTKPKEQKPVLLYLLSKFVPSRRYTEREVTELITAWLVPAKSRFGDYVIDYVTLRRALVDEMGLQRAKDGSVYWRE